MQKKKKISRNFKQENACKKLHFIILSSDEDEARSRKPKLRP
jgi:hypothetical protein